MGFFLVLLWLLGGPVLGYYVARKKGASVVLGILLGFFCGPCLGALLVPTLLTLFGSGDVQPLPPNSAGRSFGVDEDPKLGDGKR